jgi:hypothetical protein
MLGLWNCNPKTDEPFWHNEAWHCQLESQNSFVAYLDNGEEFEKRRSDVRDIILGFKFAAHWEDINQAKSIPIPDDRQHHLRR